MIQLLDTTNEGEGIYTSTNNMNLNNELLATIRSLMDQIGDLADKDPDQDADQLSPADLRLLVVLCLEARDADLTEGGRLPADWGACSAA